MSRDTSRDHELTGAEGGEPSTGTGPGGSRLGNASLSSSAGTASLRERPTDAGDEVDDLDRFVVTDAGTHLAVHQDAAGQWQVEDPRPSDA